MRIVLGVLMALHGIAHVVGFVVPWQLAPPESGASTTTILAGRVNLGPSGIRLLGLVWLGLAIGFLIAALGSWLGLSWWTNAAAWLAIVSLVLSLLGWPEARIGVPVNIAILAALLFGSHMGWL